MDERTLLARLLRPFARLVAWVYDRFGFFPPSPPVQGAEPEEPRVVPLEYAPRPDVREPRVDGAPDDAAE